MNSSSFLTDSTHLGTPCSGLALSLERQPRYLYLLCRHGRTPARRRSKMARKLIVVRTTLLKFLFWLRRSSLSLRRVNFVMFRKLDFATSNALQKTSPVHLQMTRLLGDLPRRNSCEFPSRAILSAASCRQPSWGA